VYPRRPYCGSLDVRKFEGSLEDGRSMQMMFVPMEKTIPRIRVRTQQARTLADKRVIVAIDTVIIS
jgi:hypothetical protein